MCVASVSSAVKLQHVVLVIEACQQMVVFHPHLTYLAWPQNYAPKVLELFREAEDMEELEPLHQLYRAVKGLSEWASRRRRGDGQRGSDHILYTGEVCMLLCALSLPLVYPQPAWQRSRSEALNGSMV